MDCAKSCWFGAQIHSHVNIIGRSDVACLSFDLVEKHHLATDRHPILAPGGGDFDQCLPGRGLPVLQQW